MEEKRIRYYSREHPDFPKKLLDVRPLIPGIFVRGSLPKEEAPAVSIIGAAGIIGAIVLIVRQKKKNKAKEGGEENDQNKGA